MLISSVCCDGFDCWIGVWCNGLCFDVIWMYCVWGTIWLFNPLCFTRFCCDLDLLRLNQMWWPCLLRLMWFDHVWANCLDVCLMCRVSLRCCVSACLRSVRCDLNVFEVIVFDLFDVILLMWFDCVCAIGSGAKFHEQKFFLEKCAIRHQTG